ncbi:MAG: type II toxin-antitoxin system RelE/ParE family toxin [Promicromonosporaceae bacterium]|nr:type II toxin-antitoxin system RelE/ParE family toxin [Promicromonosporaceae bacterium]
MTGIEPVSPKWELTLAPDFEAAFRRLDRQVAARVIKKLRWLAQLDEPQAACKGLTGRLSGFWRLRIGDWRVIVDIQTKILVIVALDVDHRSDVYRQE